jgi:hypothetical protein
MKHTRKEPRVLKRPKHGWGFNSGDALALLPVYVLCFSWAIIVGFSVFGSTIEALRLILD